MCCLNLYAQVKDVIFSMLFLPVLLLSPTFLWSFVKPTFLFFFHPIAFSTSFSFSYYAVYTRHADTE